MSQLRRCDMYKATDGLWYLILGDSEYAYDDWNSTCYGPFTDVPAIDAYIRSNHSNPGQCCTDDSGSQQPPDEVVSPVRKYNGYF